MTRCATPARASTASGAAYLAGALADNGHGALTTVDFAGAAYDPSPEALLKKAKDRAGQ